ncbi:MAG: hypothetical protein RSD99_18895, partial [Janthinobacterium sp.]
GKDQGKYGSKGFWQRFFQYRQLVSLIHASPPFFLFYSAPGDFTEAAYRFFASCKKNSHGAPCIGCK